MSACTAAAGGARVSSALGPTSSLLEAVGPLPGTGTANRETLLLLRACGRVQGQRQWQRRCEIMQLHAHVAAWVPTITAGLPACCCCCCQARNACLLGSSSRPVCAAQCSPARARDACRVHVGAPHVGKVVHVEALLRGGTAKQQTMLHRAHLRNLHCACCLPMRPWLLGTSSRQHMQSSKVANAPPGSWGLQARTARARNRSC